MASSRQTDHTIWSPFPFRTHMYKQTDGTARHGTARFAFLRRRRQVAIRCVLIGSQITDIYQRLCTYIHRDGLLSTTVPVLIAASGRPNSRLQPRFAERPGNSTYRTSRSTSAPLPLSLRKFDWLVNCTYRA
ncbi:hypothetical protein LX32DRAFT_405879 [Colletotrichum zoysiae]|uniref:Uncharacterized protein n=1 Tax=Colletotrichum zoysiae TaxID=1216348 RepID=A0AAD9HHR3_9PEZI|nr:hypothetical protein LX32DRAFT_405879 [Colletotrichum zoysiae]